MKQIALYIQLLNPIQAGSELLPHHRISELRIHVAGSPPFETVKSAWTTHMTQSRLGDLKQPLFVCCILNEQKDLFHVPQTFM